jgi:hypothetical protein
MLEPDGLAIQAQARDWLRDGLRHVVQGFTQFFVTAAHITRHPRQFAIEWVSGDFRAFNPLGFFATAAGVTETVGLVVDRLSGQGARSSALDLVVSSVDPYLSYFLLGLLCHAFLRPLGARRPWSLTLGMSLFAGGGPAAAADVLAHLVRLAVTPLTGDSESLVSSAVDVVAAGSLLAANAVFLAAFALGLAGIHRLRLPRILLALIAASVALSVIRVLLFKFVIPVE